MLVEMKKLEQPPATENLFTEPLMKLILNDKEFGETVNRVNEEYYYWTKVKYSSGRFEPEQVWAVAKLRRRNTPFSVTFGSYYFFWSLPARLQALLHLFDMNIGGTLEARSLIPKDEKNRYLISSIMEEAIASSQIEGAVTTRKQAKEMLRKKAPPRNKSEQMIVNNYVTIQKILTIKDDDLTPENLLGLHKMVALDTLERKEDEGAFRQSDDVNVVDALDGEIVHQPPHFPEIKGLIKDLCAFFNNDSKEPFVHPIVKGCIIHFMIGYIHPFVDGNGRTARALFYWYLLKKGYWLTEYLSISRLILKSKTQYAKAYRYTETDENDLTYFISYKLRTMKLAFDSLREYIQRKIDEKKQVTEFIKLKGVNERQAIIIKWFYEEPSLILTVKEIETRLAVSNQTARTDLQGLTDGGFLELVEINKKTQGYIKSSKFEHLIRAAKEK